MCVLNIEDIKQLANTAKSPCVSIFLPTHRIGSPQDPIRFKNGLLAAEKKLYNLNLRKSEVEDLLAPAENLLDRPLFWSRQSDGLAVFIAPGTFRVYRVPIDLPVLVAVGARFHMKPLLPMLTGDGSFHVLALSQGSVRLYEASRYSIREVDQEDIPSSLNDAIGYDVEQKSLQFHTMAPARGPARQRDAIYHGHGGNSNDSDLDLVKFLRSVDDGLTKLLSNSQIPLVVAAVDSIFSAFHRLSKHPYLVEECVKGSHEQLADHELHKKAWALVARYFRKEQDTSAIRFLTARETVLASDVLEVIVPAACNARIDTLFVSVDFQVWGKYDRQNEILEVRDSDPESDDVGLLNLAAIQCLLNGGKVYAVEQDEMPVSGPVAALFRYQRA